MTAEPWSLLILTGGASTRMGQDKAHVRVDGRTLLERLVTAAPADVDVIVVGPEPGPLPRPVAVTREVPAGGGPVAGIAAGLALVATPVVVVAAVDLPFAGPALADIARALAHEDALIPVVSGRRQPLAAAYATGPLRDALARLGPPAGRSVRDLVAPLLVREVPGDSEALMDVDTVADLAAARGRALRQVQGPGGGAPGPGGGAAGPGGGGQGPEGGAQAPGGGGAGA